MGEGSEGGHTWTKAVEIITPVPNCFNTTRNIFDLTGVNLESKIGP